MGMTEMPGSEAFPAPAPAPAPPSLEKSRRTGSQSKLSVGLLLIVIAASLFRIVTAVTDRTPGGGGLVRWTTAEGAVQMSRASGRPILYDFTAEWCGPCHVLDADGWGDAKVAALVNESFVPARVMDRVREEGKNPAWIDELQRRYEVAAFPTLVVATPDGKAVAVAQGYSGKQKLVEFLEGARQPAAAASGAPAPAPAR
jgi:thiol:disulfide interchange protein